MYAPDDDDDEDPCLAFSLEKSSVDLAYDLLNQARRAQRLRPLQRNADLEAKAHTHALTTAHLCQQVHSTASATQLQFLVCSPHAAENILRGDSVESMFETVQKEASDELGTSFKSMTRSPFTQVGIGIAQSMRDNKFYMVQLFCGEQTTRPEDGLLLGIFLPKRHRRLVVGAFVMFWVIVVVVGFSAWQWPAVTTLLWPQEAHHRGTYCRSRLSKVLPHKCKPYAAQG